MSEQEQFWREDCEAVLREVRDLLAGEFVVVDTETTGFEVGDQIIQIGVIDYTGAILFESLIKPSKPIENSFIHGITDETVEGAPSFGDVYPEIVAAIGGRTVVGYNISFDWRMLRQDCDRLRLPMPEVATWCVMEGYAVLAGEWSEYHGNYRWQKLHRALRNYGLRHEDFGDVAHNAVTDAKATLALIKKMAEWQPEVSD